MTVRRAVIIEDRPAFAQAVARVLGTLGYIVGPGDICTTALGAWGRWREAGAPALVVTDIYLPGNVDLDGIDVLRMVAEADGQIPVVVMSGQERDPGIAEVVRRMGGCYVDKPFTRAGLLHAIREAEKRAKGREPRPLDTVATTIRRLRAVCGDPAAHGP